MDWAFLLTVGSVLALAGGFMLFIYKRGLLEGEAKAKDGQLVSDVREIKEDLRALTKELRIHVQSDNERFEAVQRDQSALRSDFQRSLRVIRRQP